MGHNLFRNRMAFVGETPWHCLGKKVQPTISAEQLCRDAGLNWEVRKVPAPGARLVNERKNFYDRYLVVRDPIDEEQSEVALGLVTAAYELLQNAEAFEFFSPYVEAGFATFHTAGALGNGERVWVLAKIKGQITISKEDLVDRYLLLSNVHDGSGAVSVRFTPIRVGCQNTLNLATKNGSAAISIRHTRNLSRYLAEAQVKELWQLIDKVFGEAASDFTAMAQMILSEKQIDAYLKRLFPRTDGKPKLPERWRRIYEILDDRSVTPEGTQSTLWGLYNAVVRDEDYRDSRTASAESRLNRVWFGSGSDLKIKALSAGQLMLRSAA